MISNSAEQVWRAFVTDGVPGSGAHDPIKAEIRTWGQEVEQRQFDTRTAAIADTIEASVNFVRTYGFSTVGDDGGALYFRASVEPTHNLKFQSADLTWWEIVPDHGVLSAIAIGIVEGDSAGLGAANVTAFNDFIGYVQTFPSDPGSLAVTGPTLLFPVGDYHFNTHLNVKATIHMMGVPGWSATLSQGARLRWPLDSYGIIVHRHDTIDITTETPTFFGDGTIIEGLMLQGGGNTGTTGSGVWMRARALVKNCRIDEFAEDGVRVLATAGGAASIQGNANLWRLEGVKMSQNGSNGVFVDGGDVNAGYAKAIDAQSNGRWGIHESSFLGNTYEACHTSANGHAETGGNPTGSSSIVSFGGNLYAANVGATEAQLVATTPGTDESVWLSMGSGGPSSTQPLWLASQSEGTYFHGGSYHSDNANAKNFFMGCYREGGQGVNQLTRPTVAIGGFMGVNRGSAVSLEGFTWSGGMTFSNDQTFPAITVRDLDMFFNDGLDNLIKVVANGDDVRGIQWIGWDETNKHYTVEWAGGTATPIRITSSLNTLTAGRASALGGGQLMLGGGIFLGDGATNARHMTNGTAAPTTGEHGQGEIVWKRNPGISQPLGFICVSGGTPGTWIEIRGVANQGSHIADPTGGATVDAESRSAINDILDTLQSYGFMAAS